jgi:hypothetical protein
MSRLLRRISGSTCSFALILGVGLVKLLRFPLRQVCSEVPDGLLSFSMYICVILARFATQDDRITDETEEEFK